MPVTGEAGIPDSSTPARQVPKDWAESSRAPTQGVDHEEAWNVQCS